MTDHASPPPGFPTAILEAEAALLAPGSPFELEDTVAFGETVRAFKHRAPDLGAVLRRSASFGDAPYLVFGEGLSAPRFTYGEHLDLVAATARALAERHGVRAGDRVAILGANAPEWIVTFWASVALGAIAVGLNGWWTAPEIRRALAETTPRVLVGDRKRLARLAGVEPGVPVLVFEDDLEAHWEAYAGSALPEVAVRQDDPCLILYTSGTTGGSRGVVHTHLNITSAVMTSFFHGARMSRALPAPPLAEGEVPRPVCTLVTSPLFHVSGLHAGAITTLAAGTKSVWTVGRFDAEAALRMIEAERVTGWGYTAAILHRVLHHPRAGDFDLRSLRLIGGGGSPIPARLQERARAMIPSVARSFSVGYGLTEGTAFTSMNPGDELTRSPGSAGRPLPTVEVEIRDAANAPVPEGTDGEIHVRGPLVMKEYWRDPEATGEAILAGRWLRTGDLGRLEGGRLYLATRKRDLILRGGENVSPREIEQRLEEHPAVAEAAVVGVDAEELGQEVAAVVVVKPGHAPCAAELTAWVAEALAYYKVPSRWEIRPEPLPRNATGKVLKHVLGDPSASPFIDE